MNNIKELIRTRLREIERKEKVKILYAVESGSRGWGFESTDSDYDVRFIYVHPLDWYLSIGDKKDVIEYPISDNLDISGWDIKKALKLFKNSNPSTYEWLTSPIIYLERGNFAKRLRGLMPKFYSPVSCLHHYLSMAKGNYKAYLTNPKVEVKKYFYVLRPILACMWIDKNKLMPPMEFEKVFRVQKLDAKLVNEIEVLLARKRTGEELAVENRIEIINSFLEGELKHFKEYIKAVKAEKPSSIEPLDQLFRETLQELGSYSQ